MSATPTALTCSRRGAAWDVLARSWSEPQLIEFPILVGQYVCTAIVQNVLRIRLEDGKTGLTRR